MSAPTISILHPTRRVSPGGSFPRGWRDACDQFFATCANPAAVEYVLIVHASRWNEFLEQRWITAGVESGLRVRSVMTSSGWLEFPMPEWGHVRLVCNTGRDCVVDQLNAGAAVCSGKLLFGIMDDLEAPSRWDEGMLGLLPTVDIVEVSEGNREHLERFLDGEFVIDVTGEPTEHIVYGALTRTRYKTQGGFILDPDFESMHADNYFSHCAHRDRVVINGRGLGFRHRHFSTGETQMDETYRLENRPEAYAAGHALFMQKAHGTRSLFVCLPGETFRYEWVTNWFTLLNHLNHGLRFLLTPVFGHSTNVHCTRIELAEAVLGNLYPADLVLWGDDDNILSVAQFEMLLADLDANPGLAGVVGWCWCDNDGLPDAATGIPRPWMISCGRQGENLECKRITQDDLIKAVESGTQLIGSDDIAPDAFWSGFPVVLMRGSALATLGAGAFVPIVRPDVKYGFVSEDAAFFYRAHVAGLKFAVDLRVQVPHIKFRAIAPQHIPLSERVEALRARGVVEDLVLQE